MILSLADYVAIATTTFGIVSGGLGIAWRYTQAKAKKLDAAVEKIRTNDMAHLDEKMDRNLVATEAIGEKLDRHLDWHINHPIETVLVEKTTRHIRPD